MTAQAQTTPRGPYRKGVRRRQEIVQAAAELFAESGYTSSSMRELAQRVGLTQAGLLHHFATKEELLTEVLGLRQASVDQAVETVPPNDVEARARVVAASGEANMGLTSLFVVLSAEATAPSHPAHEYFVDHYERSVAQIQERLEVSPAGVSNETLATLAVAVLDGLQQQRLYRDGLDVEAAVGAFWNLVTQR